MDATAPHSAETARRSTVTGPARGAVAGAETAQREIDVLASDLERERIAMLIQQAAAEGRLTPAETDERLATAFAARRRSELGPLVSDLPQPAPPSAGPAEQPEGRAVRPLSVGLLLHALLVLVLAAGLIARWAVSPVLFFWPLWPIMWLLISLAVHARLRRTGRPPWRRW